MNNFDLKKFLTENKLTSNSRVLTEALSKELKDFGPDLMKRLKTAGFQTGLFKGEGQVPNDARMKIIDNPKLAINAIIKAYTTTLTDDKVNLNILSKLLDWNIQDAIERQELEKN